MASGLHGKTTNPPGGNRDSPWEVPHAELLWSLLTGYLHWCPQTGALPTPRSTHRSSLLLTCALTAGQVHQLQLDLHLSAAACGIPGNKPRR
jgi:hypothetical protein